MKLTKKILIIILVTLVVLQFFRPSKNEGESYGAEDITQVLNTTSEVKTILEKACFDCHSNHTNYTWYYNIQPVGLWMANHVNEGKEELNFSIFKTYSAKRQAHKLEEAIEMIQEGEMPMTSYTWQHPEAKLTDAEKSTLINWAKSGLNSSSNEEEDDD